MGKIKNFCICFDDEKEVYYAGDVVSGHVMLELSEPKSLIAIRMIFTGRSSVSWKEIEPRGKSKELIYYASGEEYFNEGLTIFGSDVSDIDGEGKEEVLSLSEGCHIFTFKFTLPSKPLACSFEGDLGNVRYTVRAIISRPWKFDHVTKRAFTVTGPPFFLSRVPKALTPLTVEDEKTVCCLCCATGPISISAATDKRAYLPGEFIYVSASLENMSSRSIISLEAELIQSVNYLALRQGVGTPHKRTTSHVVSSIKDNGCDAHCSATWNRAKLPIPPLPPCSLEGATFIDIRYFIKFTVDVNNTPFDIDLVLELYIGNVPIDEPQRPGPSTSYQVHNASMFRTAEQESKEIRDEEDNEFTFGHLQFTPKYLYFGKVRQQTDFTDIQLLDTK
ncbi:arrestin domain-containing protein 3-like [Anneissia japonica]|uniref:arrestin domain-containing protein 3-like n=1 Tax=Anneissia japonica TaxID=1529436 RepID=UPI0014259B6B|nr:arrestin domain-containing protein 3-like [Anneissia japonica]